MTPGHADSKDGLVLLLDAVGLAADDDTLTALLPLLHSPERDSGMPQR